MNVSNDGDLASNCESLHAGKKQLKDLHVRLKENRKGRNMK
jgi:hypothetical protein